MKTYPSPRVSIGLPVYNGERYLGQTIDSLLSQTYGDFDLLVSDNASNDGTEDICRSYAALDKRISYVRQGENIGAMGNFNYLASRASTDYFKWCAADDLIAPTFLATCIEFLESQLDFVLCHSSTRTIGFDDSELPNDIIKRTTFRRQGKSSCVVRSIWSAISRAIISMAV